MTLVPRIRSLSGVLSLVAFITLVSFSSSVFAQTSPKRPSNTDSYTIVQAPDGSSLCRAATIEEERVMNAGPLNTPDLYPINHLNDFSKSGPSAQVNDGSLPGLKIYLLATKRLNNNPQAKAAFVLAAAAWEARIKTPMTVYIEADYGPDFFGRGNPPEEYETGVIGQTSSHELSASYASVRNNLIITASNGIESSLYNLLPGTSTISTDIGLKSTVAVPTSIARAIGLLNANADVSYARARIGFNSKFAFDFDPNNGIVGMDFIAVATHEIGHALGFSSNAGLPTSSNPSPAMLDLFRFRPGVADFSAGQRLMTIGGPTGNTAQVFFAGSSNLFSNSSNEVGLSTGGPEGVSSGGGDGQQSSHWRDDQLSPARGGDGFYIGIMDPTISPGVHEEITVNDLKALNFMGYNLEANTPPPPAPPLPPVPANDNFINAQVITGCSGSVNGTNLGATKEESEPSHSPDNDLGGASIWFQWTAPNSSSVTFDTAGSTNDDTVLAVWTGSSVDNLTEVKRNDDVDLGVVRTSSVTFTPIAGTVYRIAVDGWDGEVGPIKLNWSASNCTTTTPSTVQFNQSSYSVSEASGFINITVTRSDTSGPATVKYATSDSTDANFKCDQVTGVASRKCDYHIATGKLRFAAGEQTKQFTLSIINDVYVEGSETLTLTLSSPTGATLGANTSVPVTITDNDVTAGAANPIDQTSFYVRQLYVDLLSREPDPAGLSGWTSRIDLCGQLGQAPPPCDRVTVGGDGFLRSGEFFDRQFFVLRLYRTGLGRILRYDEVGDLALVSGFLTDTDLELNKQDLVAEFVNRPEFANLYNPLSNAAFVATLLQTAGVTVPPTTQTGWVTALDGSSKTRAQVFREISERQEVSNKYAHEAQVVSAYYGFFSRNPDGAYLNYLQRLDSGEINLGDLANAFINAAEYRSRFGQ
ncbi:MAG TPA: NF038122 family metalloprotease [Pyrinomonadaceae bacterium]|jgi:hypothetical protein